MPELPRPHTKASLRADLERLGIATGDIVMVHAAMSRMGRLLHGPDTFIAALRAAVGEAGTIMAYVDWDGDYEDLLDERGCILPEWRDKVPPFDPQTSRAVRDNGILAEFVRTTPGAFRSGSPGASVAAIGAKAAWLTADHPLDYGYGAGSPLAKLVESGGKVLMAGAPLDTMTLLHHAEHLADIAGKRIKRYDVPLLRDGKVWWRMTEEFDTSDPVVDGLPDDYFAEIVRTFLVSGAGRQGQVGDAPCVLVDAERVCIFGRVWLEERFLRPA
jgi:aminoglycoside 3-N-acetyltransferase